MNDLDDAILLEIFLRLPAKSAKRIKCVSKRWKYLISQPYFVRRFIHQNSCASSQLPFTFICQYFNDEGSNRLCLTSDAQVFKSNGFSLSFLPCYQAQDEVPICIVGSYNDLLLCCSSLTCENIVYYICNPVTMQFVELPPTVQSDQKQVNVKFICHPISEQFGKRTLSTTTVNSTKYAYTIVRIPEFRKGLTQFKMEIFSSQTNEWRESYVSLQRGIMFSLKASDNVVYNEILYWVRQSHGICAFDVFGTHDGERCRLIDLPSDFKRNVYSSCIGVSEGRLRLSQLRVHHPGASHLSHLNVWELKDCNAGEWCLKQKVFFNEMFAETPELKEACKISAFKFAFHPDDADIIYFYIPYRVVSYNMLSRTLQFASSVMHDKEYFRDKDVVLPLKLPCWPTPVPILPQNS